MTLPAASNPYASPNDVCGAPFGPSEGNRATLDNPNIVQALSGTRPWVLMLGVLGMIGTGLSGIGAWACVEIEYFMNGLLLLAAATGRVILQANINRSRRAYERLE